MAIQIKNVTYTYARTDVGVFDVNMTIKDGEILAVIGSSGSGKTTLLKLIAGILIPRKGAILLDGKDVTPLPAKDRQLGIVFQSYALFPHMTAWQNISYPLKVRKVPLAERRRLAKEALERVDLGGFEDRYPLTLSGFLYSPAGLGFAYSYYLIPRVVLMILPVLVNFDKTQLITAESLGATRMQAVFDIMVPQVLPTAAAAYCLVAAVAIGAYGTALALVGSQLNILPLQLFSRISGTGTDFPGAAALSVLLMLLCSLVLGVGEIYAARKEASHGTGS